MSSLANIPTLLDPFFIAFYRITGVAFVDYFVGTFLLALMATIVGEFTLSLALRFNRRYISKMEDDLLQNHELSINALQLGDKKSYKACNKQANDVFGKYFFNMIAYSAACLWPIPFVLSWMQSRFSGVDFHFVYPFSLFIPPTGYFTTFILSYILARVLFKNVRSYLPYFRVVQKTLDQRIEALGKGPKTKGERLMVKG